MGHLKNDWAGGEQQWQGTGLVWCLICSGLMKFCTGRSFPNHFQSPTRMHSQIWRGRPQESAVSGNKYWWHPYNSVRGYCHNMAYLYFHPAVCCFGIKKNNQKQCWHQPSILDPAPEQIKSRYVPPVDRSKPAVNHTTQVGVNFLLARTWSA